MQTHQALCITVESQSGSLVIDWTDGLRSQAGFAALREACRCGRCRGAIARGESQRAAEGLALTRVEPVGDYGVCLHFDDGHDRGIYPWDYLRELLIPVPVARPGAAA
ncbi:MAG: DUF971 domain-containing protein [Gammaproteobacteria bacterium]|nr:DUF971 domain-containing protein [Gammaproteobacteria bacterium]